MIEKLFWRIKLPFPNNKIQIFSDGNDDYEYILPEYYADTCIEYGQVIKIRENGKVVDKRKRIVFGSPEIEDIETTNVENFNSILRERVGRLVRKTKCYSKKKSRLRDATELIQLSLYQTRQTTLKQPKTPHKTSDIRKILYKYSNR